MRVIVTGGRKRTDWQRVWDELSTLLEERGPFELVHGACPVGVDFFARRWATAHREVEEIRYPADWLREDGTVDRGAGPRRNIQMVQDAAALAREGTEVLVLAFPHPTGHGTQHTMRIAREAGLEVREIPPPKE